jgi:hypothetical protein
MRPMLDRLRPTRGALLVALAALVVHAPAIRFGFVDLDDRDLVVLDQAFLVSPGSLWRVFGRSYLGVVDTGHAYYRPIVAASYALDARLGGVDPRGYHLTNVLVYSAAAALLYGLLRALHIGAAPSLVGGFAFAVHPTLVSAVAWIPGRNDALLAVWSLAAWLAFARDLERPGFPWKASHLALFAAALFTKETAFVLPLVWLAHWALVRSSPGRAPLPVVHVAGWVALVAARIAVRSLDAAASPSGALAGVRLLVASLGKVALPYDPSAIAAAGDLSLWPGVVAAVALGAATVLVPGVRRGIVALAAAAFVALLLPVLAVGGTLVLDCRLVLPACAGLLAMGEVLRAAALEARTLAAGATAILVALGAVTAVSQETYRDPRAFARAAVADSPRCALAHVCLGRVYQGTGDDDRALGEYEAALALAPAEVAHNNIGVIWMKRGRWEDAERELGLEIALNPGYGLAYMNRAIVLRHEGRLGEACAAAVRARSLSPDLAADLAEEESRDCNP